MEEPEKMMKGIPNFYPRGSGIVVTGRFEYTADMCDCRLCEHYGDSLKAADTNGDGSVTIDDATQIQKFLAQMIEKL